MAGGVRGRANPDYSNTEYSQPWGGIDVSKPSSQIDPGSAISLTGTIIRGGLTNSPTIVPPRSSVPVVAPAIGSGERPLLITSLNGISIVVTNDGVYSDAVTTLTGSTKTFTKIFTGLGYASNGDGHAGSVVIGKLLYFSSSEALGVYSTNGFVVNEITAQNGSGPFIGGDFLGTISQRLVLGNIIGGDGNQTGSVNALVIDTGGTGYPASGQIVFIGGGGQNATGTFTAAAGVVTALTITSGGTGYLTGGAIEIIGTTGTGFTGHFTISAAATPSTATPFPDYFAWSFPNAYGSFDPNSVSLGGGFDQITEARGLITGLAIFEAVCFIAHNGGFTEATPNTAANNTQPFTFNPLWSADQGIVCRYGSLAQYGAMCYFLGYDQPYNLSPNGLTPIGDQIASLVQNLSYWNDGDSRAGGFSGVTSGIYGSIVEIEGEKHYLIAFSSSDATFHTPANSFTQFFDCNLKNGVWTNWNYPITVTCPVYQSYDTQIVGPSGGPQISRDNWLLVGYIPSNAILGQGKVSQMIVGQQLYTFPVSEVTILYAGSLAIQFRAECPTIAIPQTTRRLVVEYENIPSELILGAPTMVCTLYGQPQPDAIGAQAPITDTFNVLLPYFPLSATVPPNAVLTAKGEPTGTAQTSMATTLSFTTTGPPCRIIRTSLIAETTQSDLQ